MERDADKIAVMSDADDSSQVKSRGDTYYGSSSSTGSCSISPLHISSPNVVSTTSDSLPPQIHVSTFVISVACVVNFKVLSNSRLQLRYRLWNRRQYRLKSYQIPPLLVLCNSCHRLLFV